MVAVGESGLHGKRAWRARVDCGHPNAIRAGYRRDINTFMRWWSELRPAGLSAASRPLEASKSDLEQYAAWLASAEPPLAAATCARAGSRSSPPSTSSPTSTNS
jgi:hypothetical protein